MNFRRIAMAVVVFSVLLFLLFAAFGCEKSEAVRDMERIEHMNRLQARANDVVGDIQYIKDTRTGLCFAYYWGGSGYGGPALATVPCEAVPSHLLTVAK